MSKKTYFGLFSELHKLVQSDESIPDYEKFYILNQLYELKAQVIGIMYKLEE